MKGTLFRLYSPESCVHNSLPNHHCLHTNSPRHGDLSCRWPLRLSPPLVQALLKFNEPIDVPFCTLFSTIHCEAALRKNTTKERVILKVSTTSIHWIERLKRLRMDSTAELQQLEITALQSIYAEDFVECPPPKAWKVSLCCI
jgi:hypothetical protein